jgi:hypothetical protein
MPKLLVALAVAIVVAAVPGAALAHHDLPEEVGGVVGEARGLLTEAGVAPPSSQVGSGLDEHSDNMRLVANFDDEGTYRLGADIAFWGHTAVLSSYDEPGGFRLVDIKKGRQPSQIGLFDCPGPQNDVSIWRNLVFVSVDSPRSSPECGAGGASTAAVLAGDEGEAWEGIRIVDITDRANPEQINAVYADCGSHTHTLVPDQSNQRVLIYVSSYPLGGQGARCNPVTHGKISVIEVPLNDPASAEVVSEPSVRPAIGCHDITVYPDAGLAAAACITESQIWDISDPVNPEILSRIVNPAINIHHSSTFNWDADTVAIGDELGGAAVTPGCPGGDEHLPLGAIWFYDVSDPEAPELRGSFRIPQAQPDSLICTAHNFNTVPLRSDDDVLVSGWYNGGTTVVDFTDPSDPQQLGYYIPKGPTQSRPDENVRANSWSSYWYNGFIYANNFDEDINSLSPVSRGLDVFEIDHPLFDKVKRFPYLNAQTMDRVP